jgi:hypothetical protein
LGGFGVVRGAGRRFGDSGGFIASRRRRFNCGLGFRFRYRLAIHQQARLHVVGAAAIQCLKHAGLLCRVAQLGQLVQRLQAQVVQELARGRKQGGPPGGLAVADHLDPAAVLELLDDERQLMVTPRMSSMSPRVTGWR